MKNKSFNIALLGSSLLLVGGALFFLLSDSEISFGAFSHAHGASSTRTELANSSNASPTENPYASRLVTNNSEESPTKLSSLIEDVDPARYSSNPPKSAYETEILTLAGRLDLTDIEKAKALLTRAGSLPEDAKVLAVEQAAQLIPDSQYMQWRPVLFQLATSEAVRETVLTDVLNRGDKVRMKTLVDLLRQPANPAQTEVREILVAYLDEDAGSDFTKWDQAVEKFLRENAEE